MMDLLAGPEQDDFNLAHLGHRERALTGATWIALLSVSENQHIIYHAVPTASDVPTQLSGGIAP
jgi:hypothetical protein